MKNSMALVDFNLRNDAFTALNIANTEGFHKINDRQFGTILTDMNGNKRYVRIAAIVAEERDDITAEELMQAEIDKYTTAQKKKEETARKRAEKAAKDKAKREEAKKKKEQEGD